MGKTSKKFLILVCMVFFTLFCIFGISATDQDINIHTAGASAGTYDTGNKINGNAVIKNDSLTAAGTSQIIKSPQSFQWQKPSLKTNPDYGNIPLYFIPNEGQVNKKALFYAKTSRYTLWMTREGLVFDSSRKLESDVKEPTGKEELDRWKMSRMDKQSEAYERDVSRLIFQNANKNPEIVPLKLTEHRVNYFIGNDKSKWNADISTSMKVLYKDLYKNIDLKVYGLEKKIEYDWIVKPGGNPEEIIFNYKDTKGTEINNEGDLLVLTEFGELVHKRPVSYQVIAGDRVDVESSFKRLGKDTYGFAVGAYEKNYDLIIDPVVLTYSTYLGGGATDWANGIVVDSSGNTYVTGYTESTDFPTQNPYQTHQGNYDVFVTKLSSTGNSLVYSTYLGGGSLDGGRGIAVDSSGNAYVTGRSDSTDFPTQNPYQTDQGGTDVFVAKLSPAGNSLVFSTYLGGGSTDYGSGIVVDNSGNAYVTGFTESTDFPTQNPYQTDQGGRDAFVTKLSSAGNSLTYSTYLGGSVIDHGESIAVDSSGNAYATGRTDSTNFPTQNPYQTSKAGDSDVYITKLSPAGNSLVYSTYLGGSSWENSQGLTVDSSGNAYVTGETFSPNFPTQNPYQTLQGPADAFITKLSSAGNSLVYSTYLGGSSSDKGWAIVVDSSGNAYVTGYTTSTDFPTLNPYQGSFGGGWCDLFVTKLQPAGNSLIYSTYLGGSDQDYGYGIAMDNSGNVYVTGRTESTDFPTLNPYQTDQGGVDTIVAKLMYSPDLIVQTSTADAGSYNTGHKINGSAVIKNQGQVDAGTSKAKFYLGKTGNNTYRFIEEVSVGALTVGSSETVNIAAPGWTIPGDVPAGTYFLYVVADSAAEITESSESNNSGQSSNIQIGGASSQKDLIVHTVSASAGLYNTGDRINGYAVIKNEGLVASGTSKMKFYLGKPGNYTYKFIEELSVGALSASGGLEGKSITAPGWTVPSDVPTGVYFIYVVADSAGEISESNEINNTGRSGGFHIIFIQANLRVNGVVVDKGSYNTGEKISSTATVVNYGTAAAGASKAKFYLGTAVNSTYKYIGEYSVSALSTPHGSDSVSIPAPGYTIPGDVPTGIFRIYVQCDSAGEVTESDETDNWWYSAGFHVINPNPTPVINLSQTTWKSNTNGKTSPSITVTKSGTGGAITYIISETASWLSLSTTSGTTAGSFTITTTSNQTGANRSATITVSDDAGTAASKTVTVTQNRTYLEITSGTINNAALSVYTPVITVGTSQPIQGTVNLNAENFYDAISTTATPLPLAWTPSWGTHSTSYTQLAASVPYYNPTAYAVSLNLNAPSTTGTYYLWFAMAPRADSPILMSCDGPAAWADSDDIADMGASEYLTAVATGEADWKLNDAATHYYAVRAVKVVVTAHVLNVSQNTWRAPTGGDVSHRTSPTINVTKNGGGAALDYTITETASWLSLSAATGTTAGSFTITADTNTTGASRTAIVTVQDDGATGPPQIITVSQHRLSLEFTASGSLNGTTIDGSNSTLTVMKGQSITGTVNMLAGNYYTPATNILLALTPSWGTHSSSYTGIANPVPNSAATSYSKAITETAPATVGTYYIWFVMSYRVDYDYLMTCDSPIKTWEDGDDFADMGASEYATASVSGEVDWKWANSDTHYCAVRGIKVIVTEGPIPIITSISPVVGPVGTSVTINGENFLAAKGSGSVTFNGTAVTTYTSWSDTQIVVDVPVGATTGLVKVTNNYSNQSNDVTFTVGAVTCQAPWTVLQNMQYSMVVYGTAFDAGVKATTGDWVGAFGPGGLSDCRAKVQVGADGAYFMTVISDTLSETITFKLYKCSTTTTLDAPETVTVSDGHIYDNQPLHFGQTGTKLTLAANWNWISFNVLPTDTSFDTIFSGNQTRILQIKSQYQSALRVGGSWIGDLPDLSGIAQGMAYKIQTSAGFDFWAGGTAVQIRIPQLTGWNWTAYLPTTSKTTAAALASITSILEQAKSQTQSVVYSGGTFTGDLANMSPGLGHTIKVSGNGYLSYPGVITRVQPPIILNRGIEGVDLPWRAITGTRDNLIAYGRVNLEGKPVDRPGLYLASFGPGRDADCRSIQPIQANGFYYSTVCGSRNGEEISFKIYDTETGEIYEAVETLGFKKDIIKADFEMNAGEAPVSEPPEIGVNRVKVYFGSREGVNQAPSQDFVISNSGGGNLIWTAAPTQSWIGLSQAMGVNDSEIAVSVDSSGLTAGTYSGQIVLSAPNATNSPRTVSVSLKVIAVGDKQPMMGRFDTPTNGVVMVTGNVPLSGWVIDQVGVEGVTIWRDPVGSEQSGTNGLVYMGRAFFVAGARPDVELRYPDYPNSQSAGWGYTVLSHMLPDGGNGTYVLHAIARDVSGAEVEIGSKTISCANLQAELPFGMFYSPEQGGEVSGSEYGVYGWALSPDLNRMIPTDGSTIRVWVDGKLQGNPQYGLPRADVSSLFNGLANASGPMGYYRLDSTRFANGTHTIQWSVADNGNRVGAIDTRYFSIRNTGVNMTPGQVIANNGEEAAGNGNWKQIHTDLSRAGGAAFVDQISASVSPVRYMTGYRQDAELQRIPPDGRNVYRLQMPEMERLEMVFNTPSENGTVLTGFMLVGDELRGLPIGSTIDAGEGVFYWQSGAGFIGAYDLLFVRSRNGKVVDSVKVRIAINSKY